MKKHEIPLWNFIALLFIIITIFCVSCAQPVKVAHLKIPVVGFYSKLVDCDGIMIRSSAIVDDKALQVAAGKIRMMLAHIPNAKRNLVGWGAEIHIISKDQQTSDLPEFAHLKGVTYTDNMGKKTNIDARTRGLGGIYTSCGEENLLGLPGDRYPNGQDICIHEFAHNIMNFGLDETFESKIKAQYQKTKTKGLWKGAYAMVNEGEYWAELSMWYFGKHGEFLKGTASPAPGPEALKNYDPESYALLDNIYSGRTAIKALKIVPAKKLTNSIPSGASQKKAWCMFTNNTAQKLQVVWINYEGKPGMHGATTYNSMIMPTYEMSVWEIRDIQGKTVGIYQADGPYTRIKIE